MSLASKLQNILDTKKDIKSAINAKGGNITDSTPFEEYPSYIRNITTSVPEVNLTITPSKDNQVAVQNNVTITVTGDDDLIPENIAKGKNIFGIDGTYEGEIKEVKLQDVSTDGRTSFIIPEDGFDGLSRVYIDNTQLLLNEKNYNIITGAIDNPEILYDVTSTRFKTNLLYNMSGLKKVYAKEVKELEYDSVKNCLDLVEANFPKATHIRYDAFTDSYRLTYVNLPKAEFLDTYCFANTFNHPYGTPSKLNLGHLNLVNSNCLFGAVTLEEIMIGDANINNYYKSYNNKLEYDDKIYDTYDKFASLPSLVLNYCTKLKSLILPEAHGMYTLKDKLFETVPADFKIYVDESKVNDYKTDANWSQYSSRILPLERHPSYNYQFVYNKFRKAYKMLSYGNYANATEANALKVLTPRSYKGYGTILGRDLFNNCYFDKLTIGSGTFGIDSYALSGATIKTLEFEDFSKIHEVGEDAYWSNRIENVILNCTMEEYFDHFNNDDVGYIYTDDSYTTTQNVSIVSSPWGAEHIYTYPEFEVTDLFLPVKPFDSRHFLGWGSMKDAHFNNIYLNRNIYTIWNYAFENANNTNIYIPKEVTSVKINAFWNLSNSHIYCEAESKPTGWETGWDSHFNDLNVTVHWGSQM